MLILKNYLPTALARQVMQLPLSICLFPFYLRNQLTVDFELLHHRRGLKVKVIFQGQGHGSDLDRAQFLPRDAMLARY